MKSIDANGRWGTWLPYLLLVLYTWFLISLYQLVVIPLALDLSWLGLLMIAAGALLGFFAIPRRWRRTFTLLSLLILFLCYGVNSIYGDSLGWWIVEFPVLFLLFGWLASRLGKIRWRKTLTVLLATALFLAIIPLGSLPFYGRFAIVDNSGGLNRHPLFPLYPLVQHNGSLYTLGELPNTSPGAKQEEKQQQEEEQALQAINEGDFPANSRLARFLPQNWFGLRTVDPQTVADRIKKQVEQADVLRFSADNQYRAEGALPAQVRSLPFSSLGLAGFPYYISNWGVEQGTVKQQFTPVDAPQKVLTNFFDPLSLTLTMDQRARQSLAQSRSNWEKSFSLPHRRAPLRDAVLLGQGQFLPGYSVQLVVEGNNEIRLVNAQNPAGPALAVYKGDWQEPLSSDVLIADVDGDGRDELLLNTTPAKIIKLQPDRTWTTLWQSGRDTFRFEFATSGQDGKTLLITNDPSAWSGQDTRYLSAYTYQNGDLQRIWRIFKENLVFPQPLSADTWAVQMYDQQQFFLLKPLPTSAAPLLGGLYLLLLLGGYGYQLLRRGEKHAI